MPATLQSWKVLPHGPLTALEDNLLTVAGEIKMPFGTVPRRMTIVRLKDGRLIVYSAIALDENAMRRIEAFGDPAFLIVPGEHHRLDAKIWKDRYPRLRVIAPQGARKSVAETVPVDAVQAEFGDPDVTFTAVPGTHGRDSALEVSGPNGTTVVLNDIVANIRDATGFTGLVWRLFGFAGDAPTIPLSTKVAMLDDKPALAAQLRRWADMPALKRILVSHGEPIEQDPRGALRALAATLD